MQVHGWRNIVYTLPFVQDSSFIHLWIRLFLGHIRQNEDCFEFGSRFDCELKRYYHAPKGKKIHIFWRMYFYTENHSRARMVRYGLYLSFFNLGQQTWIQIRPPKFSASNRTMSRFYCTMIFDMKSIFADNRGHCCLCKDRQDLWRQNVYAMQGQKDRSQCEKWLGPERKYSI